MINSPRTVLYCVSALAITLAASGVAFAQGMKMDKPMAGPTAGQFTVKTLAENEKVTVLDVVARPGDASPIKPRPMRVIYYVSGGTFERTYADGKKEKISDKTGETKLINEQRPYGVKNIGKTTVHLMEVELK